MSSEAPRKIRWGILGCGRISHDFVNAVRHLPDVEVVACGARSLSDAQSFAQLFSIPAAYGSYAELVADKQVEVIYVGTLHPQHAEHSILALEAGRHVLCEKPLAVTHKQGEAIIAAAKKAGKFAMEAMWSRFVPSICKVRELIASGLIGKPKMVEASFGFKMNPTTPRLWENKHAGGAILDLAVYPIALANMVFGQGGARPPKRIVALGELSEGEGVDIHNSITLQYGPGELACLNTTFLATTPNEAFITGDKGYIHIHAASGAWHCSQLLGYRLEGEKVETMLSFTEPLRPDQREMKFMDSQLLKYECMEVNECIRRGDVESKIYSQQESLEILKIMDECRQQIGVVYAEDKAN